MARPSAFTRVRVRVAAAALIILGAPAAANAAAPGHFRDPYLGGKVAFSIADGKSGCVARFEDRRGITCDSTVEGDSGLPPYERPGVPAVPDSCGMGWGVRFHLPPRGHPRPVCASTWMAGGHRVLRTRQSLKMGAGITCRALPQGVRCVNRTRHGFVLTTSRVRLF